MRNTPDVWYTYIFLCIYSCGILTCWLISIWIVINTVLEQISEHLNSTRTQGPRVATPLSSWLQRSPIWAAASQILKSISKAVTSFSKSSALVHNKHWLFATADKTAKRVPNLHGTTSQTEAALLLPTERSQTSSDKGMPLTTEESRTTCALVQLQLPALNFAQYTLNMYYSCLPLLTQEGVRSLKGEATSRETNRVPRS